MEKKNLLVLTAIIILITFFISNLIVNWESVLVVPLILAFLILLISIYNPEIGLIFLVFSMLLSPEIKVANLPKREVVIRIDDLLIFAVLVGWFIRSVFIKKLIISVTPILLPMFLYTLILIISTFLGILEGRIMFQRAIFYILKYIEYFVIYFLVTNIVYEKKIIPVYIVAFIITAVIVNIHGISLIGKVDRVYAPFDTPQAVIGSGEVGAGEANTYGGYLIIMMSLAISLFCYSYNISTSICLIIFFISCLIPFIYTLSRSSYLTFFPVMLSIIFLTEKKKNILIFMILIGIVLTSTIFKQTIKVVTARIQKTFSEEDKNVEQKVFGIRITDLSALTRVESFQLIFKKFLVTKPVLGYGVTGVGLMDAQIPLIVGESGLLGLFCFFWMIFEIYKHGYLIFKNIGNNYSKVISLCVISCLTGLLVQSIGANTFIIIRIMEPFWFLCGLMMIMSRIYEEQRI